MGDVHDTSYYLKCMMGGALACGVTHAAICPLDIVKCRKQVFQDFNTTYENLLFIFWSTQDILTCETLGKS